MTIPHEEEQLNPPTLSLPISSRKRASSNVKKIARLFIEVLMDYGTQKKYLLHEFVAMPDHLRLTITPTRIRMISILDG